MKVRLCAALFALGAVSACARVTQLERNAADDSIDVGPLLIESLLMVPGIVPGVVALGVDFGRGAIVIKKSEQTKDDVARSGALAH